MAIVTLDAFVPQVVVELPECPEPVAVSEVRNAIISLCDEALVWQEDLDPLVLIPGQSQYDLDTPAAARTATILDVYSNQVRKITPVTREWLFRFDPLWNQRLGTVSWYYQPDPDTIQFIRVPDSDISVYIHCAFAPTRTGNQVPAYIFEQYLETIKYGAWGRLMSQPMKPWTNPKLAADYLRLFGAGVEAARVEVTKGRVRSDTTIQMKPFA